MKYEAYFFNKQKKVTHLAEEASDLSPALGALSLNLGTLNDEQVAGMLAAGIFIMSFF
jgi:hydroxyethylthiazole kinase-like sugar kinase family protein